jgi:ligand-binding sensor domain-containing protein
VKKLIYFVLILLPATSFSQIPSIVLTQLTEENGLSDNHVQCVLKDREGFVWVGTADGLNLLDGSVINVFRHSTADTASLLNNDVLSLAETVDGNVWIATAAGLSCYRRQDKSFVNVGLPHSPYGASNIVNCIHADKDNHIWCATDGGLYRYDIKSKTATPFYNRSAGEPLTSINRIASLLPDKDGNIWLATFGGLWMFDTHNQHFTRMVGRTNDAGYEGLTTVIFEDARSRIWFGNWSKGLKLFDRKTNKVTDLNSAPSAISHVIGINEMEMPDGRNLILLNGALNCFDAGTGRFLQMQKPAGLAENPVINRFYRSADGWMWMCSAKGLFIYNPQRQFFSHHVFPKAITSQNINFIEWKGQLLIGGQGEDFLTAYDKTDHVKTRYANLLKGTPVQDPGSSASVLCFSKDRDNDLFIGNSGGILRYDPKNGSVKRFVHREGDSSTIPKNFIQHIFIDSENVHWIFPWREGIYSMNPANGSCRLLCKGLSQHGNGIKGLVIAGAAEDAQGNIWMADLDEGIILFDRASNKFSKPFIKQLGAGMHSSRIIYRDGCCYSFADNRLLKWNTQTRALQVIPLPPQAGGYIYDLVLDQQGNWWIATKKGLFLFSEPSHSFRHFTTSDGLSANDMDGNFYLKNNGDILFGTPAYFTRFNPLALLNSSLSKATVIVTGIEANGENIMSDSSRKMHLSYTQNNLSFHWAVTDYTSPFHNRYYCRLQGIDGDWKYIGNRGEIQYANLSPGRYTLLLMGATANGSTSQNIISIPFRIDPPFWKSGLFLFVCIALVAAVAYWLVSRRIKGIRKKAAIEKQMSELELKALKAQMNPHFIFNSLSSIQESIVNNKTEAASRYLGKFSKLIRAVLENSDRKLITLQQEIDYLKLYLELESFRFDDFSFSLDAEAIEDVSFIKISPMLVQPYVENAIKHGLSHKEGSKKLSISFRPYGLSLLQVVIEDNGIGRRQSAIINESRVASHQSMGMKITEERLHLQKAPVTKPVEIADLENENGEATGTRVAVYLSVEG